MPPLVLAKTNNACRQQHFGGLASCHWGHTQAPRGSTAGGQCGPEHALLHPGVCRDAGHQSKRYSRPCGGWNVGRKGRFCHADRQDGLGKSLPLPSPTGPFLPCAFLNAAHSFSMAAWAYSSPPHGPDAAQVSRPSEIYETISRGSQAFDIQGRRVPGGLYTASKLSANLLVPD